MSTPKMVKTSTPGIYKRGERYVVVFRRDGRQVKRSCRTLDEARRFKARVTLQPGDGQLAEQADTPFHVYATEWIDRYQGSGKGLRDATRQDYRRDLVRYAFEFFPERKKVRDITPLDISRFIAWLCNETEQGRRLANEQGEVATRRRRRQEAKRLQIPVEEVLLIPPLRLADATIRRILAPVRACLATALRENVIQRNPTAGAVLPARDQVQVRDDDHEDDHEVRALTRAQLEHLMVVVPDRHRLLVRFLVATGLRWSEVAALQWRHLRLDGSDPHVRVRRALVRGVYAAPKSKYGKREVPLAAGLVNALRAQREATEWPGEDEVVFSSMTGTVLIHGNAWRRWFKPAAEEAGVPWAGFHTLRHTFATLLFAAGRNAVQVQRLLGHHSPAFTINTYVHLLDEDVGVGIDPADGNFGQQTPQHPAALDVAEDADLGVFSDSAALAGPAAAES